MFKAQYMTSREIVFSTPLQPVKIFSYSSTLFKQNLYIFQMMSIAEGESVQVVDMSSQGLNEEHVNSTFIATAGGE